PDPVEIAVRTRVGGADRIVVLLESPRPLDGPTIAPVLDTLAERLSALPDVRRVEYRVDTQLQSALQREAPGRALLYFDSTQLAGLAHRLSPEQIRAALATPSPDTMAAERALFPRLGTDPLGVLAPFAAVLERALGGIRLRIADGYLTLPGGSGFVLLVEPERPLGDLGGARALVSGIARVLRDTEQSNAFRSLGGVRLVAVGRPISLLGAIDTIRSDALRVGAASAITAFLLLLILFRRPLAPLILVGVMLYGLAVTGAVAYLVVGSVSVIAWVFVAVLIGLGDEFAFYIAAHYWITGDPSLPRDSALASAIRRPARGLLFSCLAMSGAMLSLAVVSYPVMSQLAWLAALGMLLLLAASVVVLPVALSYTAPARHPHSLWLRGMAAVHRMGRRPRRVLVGWALLLLALVAGATRLRFEPHPWKVALRGNRGTQELERARRLLGVWPSPIMMVSAGATQEEALERDRQAVAELDPIGARAGIATIESLSRWLPSAEQQRGSIAYLEAHAPQLSPARFERNLNGAMAASRGGRERITPVYRAAVRRLLEWEPREITVAELARWGLDSLIARHLVHHKGRYLAVSYLYLNRFPWSAGVIPRFEETLRLGGGPALARARFVGDALRGSSQPAILRRDLIRTTLVGLSLVALVLAVQFRRWKPTLLCLVPLVCAVAAALGLMGMLGIELNVLTLSLSPLLVGLSIDDAIHIMDRLEREEAVGDILTDSGAAMIITTLTTTGGLACLVFAKYPGVAELGLVGSFGIVVALGASLQLLPALHAMGRRNAVRPLRN
ncbi:MAG: MMPL family transporter, partial [Gemmatimonadales bacterium]|nr:MMPL family transporter [Gemmatimonadales bacterium]